MASLGQIIFYSMVTLIIIFATLIILILALSFSGSLSEVMSSNTSPTANIGEDTLLSCILNSENEQARVTRVSVTWKKLGVLGDVYKYEDGAPELSDQNSKFKGRTQLFTDALATGNASLLLRDVRRSDKGFYSCGIGSSGGGGWVNIHLRVAGFSAPTFKFSDGDLVAEASRWYPKPTVTWTDFEDKVLSGSTSYGENSAGIFTVFSTLSSVNVSDTYTCRIENDLVAAISPVTVTETDPGVSARTYFTFSAASSLLASTYLSITTCILCIYYLF